MKKPKAKKKNKKAASEAPMQAQAGVQFDPQTGMPVEPEAKPEKKKKSALDIIRIIATTILVIAAAAMMIFTIVSVRTFDQADRDIFGYKAFIVLSDSMSATDFDAGDLILVKEEDPSTFVEGDIISYTSTAESNFGEIVTHKIRSLTTTDEGAPAFITYGTTTGKDDPNPVTYEYVIGKYQKAIPKVGSFFMFLKTVPGYLLCIFLPFFLLILVQGVNSVRLFRQYKREEMAEMEAIKEQQKAEVEAERQRLEAERLESMRMIEELKRVQMQMATGQPVTPPAGMEAGMAPAAGMVAPGMEAAPAQQPAPAEPQAPVDPMAQAMAAAYGQPAAQPQYEAPVQQMQQTYVQPQMPTEPQAAPVQPKFDPMTGMPIDSMGAQATPTEGMAQQPVTPQAPQYAAPQQPVTPAAAPQPQAAPAPQAQPAAPAQQTLTREQQIEAKKQKLMQLKASMTEEQWAAYVARQKQLQQLKASMTPEQWAAYVAQQKQKR